MDPRPTCKTCPYFCPRETDTVKSSTCRESPRQDHRDWPETTSVTAACGKHPDLLTWWNDLRMEEASEAARLAMGGEPREREEPGTGQASPAWRRSRLLANIPPVIGRGD